MCRRLNHANSAEKEVKGDKELKQDVNRQTAREIRCLCYASDSMLNVFISQKFNIFF